ncbi:MAG: hypothetical protein KJP07_17350, partial [Desulfatitalea sp.]|nr:hypothetical protein [Desulfatitalea sp.]
RRLSAAWSACAKAAAHRNEDAGKKECHQMVPGLRSSTRHTRQCISGYVLADVTPKTQPKDKQDGGILYIKL